MKCWLFISAAIFFMFGCVTNDSPQPSKKELFGYKYIKLLPAPEAIQKGMSAKKVLDILGDYTSQGFVWQDIIIPNENGDYERRLLFHWDIYDIKNDKPCFLKVSIYFSQKANINDKKDKKHEYPILQKEGKSWFVSKIDYKNYPFDEIKSKYEHSLKLEKIRKDAYKKWQEKEKESK